MSVGAKPTYRVPSMRTIETLPLNGYTVAEVIRDDVLAHVRVEV